MLIFVGIGPGDPELITLKAARVLREADAIVLPESGGALRVTEGIVREYLRDKAVVELEMPMKGMRDDWRQAHQKAAQKILELLEQYSTVAYPVLGDPGVYATSSYLYELIRGVHPCQIVPGVPTMCAAAARLGAPLCRQRETLTVLDSFDERESLPAGACVVMKCGKKLDALKRLGAAREAYAVRNLGLSDEWTGRLQDIPGEDASYFTTALILPE